MNLENIYFIDTPVDVQDEYYYFIIEQLQNIIQIKEDDIIYLKYTIIFNMFNKRFFKGFIFSSLANDKDFNKEPDFLIFIK